MGGERSAGGRGGQSTRPAEARGEAGVGRRELDALYQNNPHRGTLLAARVIHPEVDEEAKEVRFEEVYQSDDLVLADECEFQKYRLLVRRVGDATRIDKSAPLKGRVLKGVTAEIVGYREQ